MAHAKTSGAAAFVSSTPSAVRASFDLSDSRARYDRRDGQVHMIGRAVGGGLLFWPLAFAFENKLPLPAKQPNVPSGRLFARHNGRVRNESVWGMATDTTSSITRSLL